MHPTGSVLVYLGGIALLAALIAWVRKNPAKVPSKRTIARFSGWLLLCAAVALSLARAYATYFRPIHRSYRGDYDTLLVKASFYSSGRCVVSLMDRTDPKLTSYMHFGDYVRVGQKLRISWKTMSRRSEFELRDESLHLPAGSYPYIGRPMTLPAKGFNRAPKMSGQGRSTSEAVWECGVIRPGRALLQQGELAVGMSYGTRVVTMAFVLSVKVVRQTIWAFVLKLHQQNRNERGAKELQRTLQFLLRVTELGSLGDLKP